MLDGTSIEAKSAAVGYLFVPRVSTGTNSARDFQRSEGARDHAQAALKKTACGCCGRIQMGWYDRKVRRVRDLSCGDTRIFLEVEVRRGGGRRCGKGKQERLDFLADNPFYTKRFASYVGQRCRAAPIKDVAKDLALDWHTVKALDKQYMEAQLKRVGTPGPQVIGVDEISIRKGHDYRIVVSDLVRGRPIWFGGEDRSQASMSQFYAWLGKKKSSRIRLAVMDMWKPFRLATNAHAPQAAILFDKFHVIRHLGEALDAVRKSEYARLRGRERRYIKGQKYTLLSRRENLSLDGKKALKVLLAANRRLNTAYVLKESFGQLWGYEREGWARRFASNGNQMPKGGSDQASPKSRAGTLNGGLPKPLIYQRKTFHPQPQHAAGLCAG